MTQLPNPQNRTKLVFYCLFYSLLLLSLSACLKTRAQLKDDSATEDRDSSKPVAVQPVQPVQDQGRYAVDELKEELTQLVGRIEDLEHQQKELAKANRSEKSDQDKAFNQAIEGRLTQLEQNQANLLEEVKKLQQPPVDPSEVFDKANAQFKKEEYGDAAESFSQYLNLKNIKKQEDALFFRGECYYKLKDYKKAIVDYSKFPEKFTRSSYMPKALYRIALSFEALGMKEDAQGFYQELIEKFPKSSEAKKAKKKKKS